MLKIIVGLGNFTHTGSRHNMGMLALDHLVSSLLGPRSFVLNKNLGGWIASGDITLDSKRHSLVFYKPKEYMNLNGIPIARTLKQLGIRSDQMLVLHDDLEKKLGAVGMKKSGSANGHNGIRSVISATHSSDFKRMKIGIGRPNDRDMVSQYVLSDFTAAELEVIQTTVFPQVLKCLDLLFAPGPAPPVQTAT